MLIPSVPRNVLLMLLAFILSNVGVALQYSTFTNMPGPMANMFNESFSLHYGSYLSPIGVSTIMSFSTGAAKAGELTAILLVAPLLDRFGRRFVAIHLRFVLLIVGSILTLLSTLLPSFECFIASFFFTMISFEIKFFATTLFIIECTPDQIRGFVTILQALADVAGAVVATTLARPSIIGTEENWWQFGDSKTASGYWEREEARKALIYYQGESEETERILDSYEKEIIQNNIPTMSWKDAWQNETIRKSIYVILALYFAINLSPYASELMYSTVIQMIMGLSNETALTLNSISRVISIPLSIPISLVIERFGRRPIVFTALAILCLKTVLMTFGLCLVWFAEVSATTRTIAILNDFLSSLVGSMGVISMASLFVCELTPLNARVAVSQLCNLIPSVTMIPVVVLLPMSLSTFPPSIYILSAVSLPPLYFYIYRNLPETTGRRVCDIIEDFDYCVRSRAPTARSRATTKLSTATLDEYSPLLANFNK